MAPKKSFLPLLLTIQLYWVSNFGIILEWSYELADQWSGLCSNGSRQSPININTNSVYYDSSLSRYPLKFVAHSANLTGELSNNGYTVQFSVNKTAHPAHSRPRITGGGLVGGLNGQTGYIFEQFHFHWGTGPTACDGSEHAIDGRRTPMEIHILYYNSKYTDFSSAVNYADGTVGMAFFIAPTSDNETKLQADYSQLAVLISQNADEDSKTTATINLGQLIPKWVHNVQANDSRPNIGTFYRYEGSWTTPPCYENVIATVYRDPILVPISTLAKFWRTTNRHVYNETTRQYVATPMVNNFRPLQNLSGRTVRTNKAVVKANLTTSGERFNSSDQAMFSSNAGTKAASNNTTNIQKQEKSSGRKIVSNLSLLFILSGLFLSIKLA